MEHLRPYLFPDEFINWVFALRPNKTGWREVPLLDINLAQSYLLAFHKDLEKYRIEHDQIHEEGATYLGIRLRNSSGHPDMTFVPDYTLPPEPETFEELKDEALF